MTAVIKRDGNIVTYDREKIRNAILKAYLFDEFGASRRGADGDATRAKVEALTQRVELALSRHGTATIPIENIQDIVELELMRTGEHEVARGYVLFRSARNQHRATTKQAEQSGLLITRPDGTTYQLDREALRSRIRGACAGNVATDYVQLIETDVVKNLYNGAPEGEILKALILCSRQRIELEPEFSKVAAIFALEQLRHETSAVLALDEEFGYEAYFQSYVGHAIKIGLLNAELTSFDLQRLAKQLQPQRDGLFSFLGLQTLYDRYFLVDKTGHAGLGNRFEMPQAFFMRVAMGLALNEANRDERAIEFYHLLSSLDFMASTPTLFNAATNRAQLSSCYLTTVPDNLDGIFEAIKENALLSKFAGGLGNDWTPVRAMGSHIKGTNGESQGVIPFLKVVNDTAVAVNQGGKRKGAVCAYMETWHLDIEEFIQLRKNTGDDRRRTHDMNTANWVPDLFMRRVMENAQWTLFSPSDTPDLHELYGREFEARYCDYERKAAREEIKLFKTVSAVALWRKLLSMIYETGHPWITFKDPCNVRSPQQHVGVVHSSNLCTEITLNTSATEIAVCNLGSINLVNHMARDGAGQYVLDQIKLQRSIRTAMRMLDNVIDINYYAVDKARDSNIKHRPVGLGIMGFHDALYLNRTPYASQAAVDFADTSMEAVCYYAYLASTELAQERGRYATFPGSLWSQGVMPHESIELLKASRGGYLEMDASATMDWSFLKSRIQKYGMRNSNCVAIAPTATIANIVGVSSGIDPTYLNLAAKSNLGGDFTVVNEYLVHDLRRLGLWDAVMLSDLKYHDGALAQIERVPAEMKALYATAFEIDPKWLIESASRRQKWIDQSQSLNLYLAMPSGKKLDEMYKLAWLRGLKATYYLRTRAASSAEKSTGTGGELNAVSSTAYMSHAKSVEPAFCGIDNPECEACQ